MTSSTLRALPRVVSDAIAATREPFGHAAVLPSSFRSADDIARLSRTLGGLGAFHQLVGQVERIQRAFDPLGIANLGAMHRATHSSHGIHSVLGTSLGLERRHLPQLADVLGPVAALREQRRFLGDMLRTTRAPERTSTEMALGANASLWSALKSARSFERLDARVTGMFRSAYSDALRTSLVVPSLGAVAALSALDRPTNLGILTALPGMNAASLGWFRDALGSGHIRAALVHAERSQQRSRQTWRIELPAEVPCDRCGAFVFEDVPEYITFVGAPPHEEVSLTTLCGDCAGTGEEEAHARTEDEPPRVPEPPQTPSGPQAPTGSRRGRWCSARSRDTAVGVPRH